jgi:glutathione S-transferase
MADDPIFHIALPDDWADAFKSGDYRVSTRAMSLQEVGFIHCSPKQQVEATARRFYADVAHLVLLTIDPVAVPSKILWELPGPDADELFPHIYGPLPVAAVVIARYWSRGNDGWALPK